MISMLHGKLTVNGGRYAVIDCGGVGYFINIPYSVRTANSTICCAVEALVSLGYMQKKALFAVTDIDPALPLETIIPQALRKLYM